MLYSSDINDSYDQYYDDEEHEDEFDEEDFEDDEREDGWLYDEEDW